MLDRARAAGLVFDASLLKDDFELKDDCCAELHPSHKLHYGFKVTREVGKTPTEYVHRSALDRWEKKAPPPYRPAAIADRIGAWLSASPRQDVVKVAPAR